MALLSLLLSLLALSSGQPLQAALAAEDAASAPAAFKLVNLSYAQYQSNVHLDDGVTSFLGIRYAAPPTGSLRFAAPQAPPTVRGIQNATAQPMQCFQNNIAGTPGLAVASPFREDGASNHTSRGPHPHPHPGPHPQPRPNPHPHPGHGFDGQKRDTDGISNEDCLFLNVHVPDTPSTPGPLPVVVYIHGGGYDAGNVSLYPVQDFVKATNFSLVSVSIQYRLGVFGFLGGSEVKNGGALNAGLLDQEFALQWVQTHIASFGGDPTKVAIWGQSAGAGSMLQHIVAHGGDTQPPLFRAVLANSPFLPFQYAFDDPIVEDVYARVASAVNCSHASDTLACLRAAPATALSAADQSVGEANFMEVYTFVPVVDGDFIVERPTVTMARGTVNGQALVVSNNAHEGVLFTVPATLTANNFTLARYITQLFPRLGSAQVAAAVALYEGTPIPGVGTDVPSLAAAVIGDAIFVCPGYDMLRAFGDHGWKADFDIPPGTHAEDLSYEFLDFGIPPTFPNADFMRAFRDAFLNTALALDPNAKFEDTIAPQWPAWAGGQGGEMLFNQTEGADPQPVVKTVGTDAGQMARCA
ncbi:alpha/beta-hydrolase [Dentipellis sp. KUC8613]|nr:alpha/beta-hydrolase [Dentipellis sp. KUC8613]